MSFENMCLVNYLVKLSHLAHWACRLTMLDLQYSWCMLKILVMIYSCERLFLGNTSSKRVYIFIIYINWTNQSIYREHFTLKSSHTNFSPCANSSNFGPWISSSSAILPGSCFWVAWPLFYKQFFWETMTLIK